MDDRLVRNVTGDDGLSRIGHVWCVHLVGVIDDWAEVGQSEVFLR